MARRALYAVTLCAAVLISTTVTQQPTAAAPLAAIPTVAAVSVPAPSATVTVHTGDTLWGLASAHCGRGELYPRLARASGIVNPDWLVAGRTRVVLDCAGTVTRPTPVVASRSVARTATAASRLQTVINYAMAQRGDPYVWGAAGPNTWDCSGLVMAAYARVGIRLPHQSGQMLAYGRKVTRAQLRPGDLVWPHSGHVVMYIGGGKIIEAPKPGQRVHVTTLYAFWTARRLIG